MSREADQVQDVRSELSDRVDGSSVTLWLAATAVGLLALVVALVGVFLPAAGTGAADGRTAVAPTVDRTVSVQLGDLFVKPSKITLAAGTRLTLKVTNNGAMQHDLKLNGTTGTKLLAPGASQTVSLGAMKTSAQAWCTVPGHKAAGMVVSIAVTGASNDSDYGAGPVAGVAPSAKNATIDPNAMPAKGWVPRDPALQPAPGGTEHEVTMRATEKVMEVAPGVRQEMWTFNDQVPGPTLHGRLGDVFTVTLVNDSKMGHSIDFHASRVAWSDEMRTIQPGESLVYQFRAEFAGAWMYHCGTAPTLHHIGNGMYGAVIIDPPGLTPVDHEYAFVQSELYLGPQGQPGDLTKMQREDFDAVVFNGYWNQYKFSPIQVQPNERIRAWVIDDGPSENSAFHVVGTVFDTVFKEGAFLIRPGSGRGGSQVLDLQPAQGGFVEFSFAEVGYYPMVTHKFANVGKGALGLFRAGDATLPPGSAGH